MRLRCLPKIVLLREVSKFISTSPTSELFVDQNTMDITTAAMIIPGGGLLGIIILFFLQHYLRNNSLPYINARHLKFFARRYASDRLLHRYFRRVGIATPPHLISLLSIVAVNATVLAVFESRSVLIKRSGEAVLVNLTLLLICGRPNAFLEPIHISRQFVNFIHRWLGFVAMVECVIHLVAALSLIRSGTRPFTNASSIAGLTVSQVKSSWDEFPR